MAEEKSGGRKKVMVAIDESECSHYALEWALDHLKDTISESDLVIFTALPQSEISYVYVSSLGAARKFFSLFCVVITPNWIQLLTL